MVNLLETLYVVTACCILGSIASLVASLRQSARRDHHRRRARRLGVFGATGVVVCALMYAALRP